MQNVIRADDWHVLPRLAKLDGTRRREDFRDRHGRGRQQSVMARAKDAAVQGSADFDDPGAAEILKKPGVHGHDQCPHDFRWDAELLTNAPIQIAHFHALQ